MSFSYSTAGPSCTNRIANPKKRVPHTYETFPPPIPPSVSLLVLTLCYLVSQLFAFSLPVAIAFEFLRLVAFNHLVVVAMHVMRLTCAT